MPRTALVTGGNRGIGFQVCRQLGERGLAVVLTARDREHGMDAARILRKHGLEVSFEQLDVASADSVQECARRLASTGTDIDVLVNNAGIYPTMGFFQVREDVMMRSLQVNMIGPWRTVLAFVPGMVRRGYGRVVNVSSGYGSINDGVPGPPAYSIAKAGLDAMTRSLASAVGHANVKVNAICPGWVATDMGGAGAPVSAEDAASNVVWAATLPDDGPTNGFFRNRRPIQW